MCHNGCMTEYIDRTNHPDMSDTALFVYRFLQIQDSKRT